jgi:hypothetical protein
MIEVIDRLLAVADPQGEAARRLTALRAQVAQNVMLGPGPRRYIQALLARLDNIECQHLQADGVCAARLGSRASGVRCQFDDIDQRFDHCARYARPVDRRTTGKEVL